MDDTNKLAGVGGMRFIADTNPHVGRWHTIMVCEDAVFDTIDYEDGTHALQKIHAPGNAVPAAWCTPITANTSKIRERKGPFTRIKLKSGVIAAYNDYLP